MNKLIKDGMVAVILSPGFGAGWYTWNRCHPDMAFDAGLAELIIKGDQKQILSYATLKWPDAYLGGAKDLVIEWVPQGTVIQICEYDGSESIEHRDSQHWFTV